MNKQIIRHVNGKYWTAYGWRNCNMPEIFLGWLPASLPVAEDDEIYTLSGKKYIDSDGNVIAVVESFEDFLEKQRSEIKEWCKNNNEKYLKEKQ